MQFLSVLAASLVTVASATNYDVSVGANGQLRFDPETVTAAVGDVVNFTFHPKNHTVSQSSFNEPCVKVADGFDSGFMAVAAEGGDLPSFQVTVNDTNPVWVYCRQTGHCGKGMVFAINAPADPNPHSFSAFQQLALSINGTNTTSSSVSASASAYVTPPAPSEVTVTATVTVASSTWTTTYASYDGTPPPTPAAQPQDHKITVGANGQLAFSPSNISAAIGDTVTFEFHPKNHTVTQSSFLAPCQPLADTSSIHQVGFDSGFNPVASESSNLPTFQIKINDTAPIWGFCGQTGHCGKGMVFSINAVESGPNNFAAFQALAEHVNGTSTTSGSGTSTSAPSSSSTKASSAMHIQKSPVVVVLVAGLAALFT
ncbi:Cupredoxin [Gloeophyllum trabeum ATCC 11539]|uniref:Cupredoxin n=1 Tax=Gloeophyllum trabeum (strain ATCC 11539 / FP-39264 / Madison 617) TaxID=670483 RepID=S7RY48_GLOTA|nr:Cupredoxin [Gloeophyllum trabeum ATCC 11539]EPQ58329.1 Cupredoxin [Gloeophyllum trabeum ATCC 11539]